MKNASHRSVFVHLGFKAASLAALVLALWSFAPRADADSNRLWHEGWCQDDPQETHSGDEINRPPFCDALSHAVDLALDLEISPSVEREALARRVPLIASLCIVEIDVIVPERLITVEDRIAVDLDMIVKRRDRMAIDKSYVAITTQRGIFLPVALNDSHFLSDREINHALHSFEAVAFRMRSLLSRKDVIDNCTVR